MDFTQLYETFNALENPSFWQDAYMKFYKAWFYEDRWTMYFDGLVTTVQVTIRDPNFKDICRQKRLSAPTYVSRDLTDAAMELIRASWNPKAPVRALTITAQNLMEEQDAGEQLDLFAAGAAPRRDRLEKLEKAMDGIRDRFGRDAIAAASTVHRDKAEVKEDHRLPPVD